MGSREDKTRFRAQTIRWHRGDYGNGDRDRDGDGDGDEDGGGDGKHRTRLRLRPVSSRDSKKGGLHILNENALCVANISSKKSLSLDPLKI